MEVLGTLETPEACLSFIKSNQFLSLLNEQQKYVAIIVMKKIAGIVGAQPTFSSLFYELYRQTPLEAIKMLECLFSTDNQLAIELFCREDFIEELVECCQSEDMKENICDLLVEAAGRSACHQIIEKQCFDFVCKCFGGGLKSKAVLVLAKISFPKKELFFTDRKLLDYSFGLVGNGCMIGLEIIIFLSVIPSFKDAIAKNSEVIAAINAHLRTNNLLNFGISALLLRLVELPDTQEAELAKLKSMACQIPVEQRSSIESRISVIMENAKFFLGSLNLLVRNQKNMDRDESSENASGRDAIFLNVSKAFLSLSFVQRHRGTLVQQGAIPTLITLTEHSSPCKENAHYTLCRLCATLNPSVLFLNQKYLDMIQPFLAFLDDPSDLKVFESLLALTNISSVNDPAVHKKLSAMNAGKVYYSLLFSNNENIQRAAAESICNLISHPECLSQFINYKFDIKVLVALCDHQSPLTQRASLGALAQLTVDESVCQNTLLFERTIPILKSIILDNTNGLYDDILHRCLFVIMNLLQSRASQSDVVKREIVPSFSSVRTENEYCLELIKEIKQF